MRRVLVLTVAPERGDQALQRKKTMEMKTWRPTCEKVTHLMTSSLNRKLVSKTASPPMRICPMSGLINLRRVRENVMKKSNDRAQSAGSSCGNNCLETGRTRYRERNTHSANVYDQAEPPIREGEMQFDDTRESDISLDEDWPTLSSATIDYPTSSEAASIGRVSPEPPNERQRPARIANRPPRYRDCSFETHFQPVPRRHCRRIQRQDSTGHNNINAEVRQDLGRGVKTKNVASTGNANARQEQPLRPGTSHHPRSIASFHPYPSNDLLATSRSLNNNRRRYRRTEKGRIKFATLPYPLMGAKDKENSIETSSPLQKRSRTAHLQLESTRLRASTDRRSAAPRGDEAAEKVISAPPPAARRRARALSADRRLITTTTARDRQAAVSSNKSTSVSVNRTMQSDDDSPPEKSVHVEPSTFQLQHQNPQLNTADVQMSLKVASSAIKCKIADATPVEKIKIAETIASATTDDKKSHKHRFRRKKRQKDRRNSQEE